MKKIIAMIVLMLPMAVMAQEEKDTTVVIPQYEQALRAAAEFSKFGYAYKDALSLIQAARLTKMYDFTCVECVKAATGGKPVCEIGEKKGQVSLDPTKLLADAKTMADSDGVLLALIDDVDRDVRGASGGPKYANSRVEAHDYDIYNVTFRRGELAMVIVVGDGDTDLDLYVYDNNGNLVASDNDYTDDCVCSWTPRWTGNFRIKIVNRGNVYNRYILRTN